MSALVRHDAQTLTIDPVGTPDAWRGVAAWTPAGDLWQPWRIPHRVVAGSLSEALTARSAIPNGARIVVSTDAASIELDTDGDPARTGYLDVVRDGAVVSTVAVPASRATVRAELGPGPKTVEVWLPHSVRTRVGPLRLLQASYARPGPWPDRRWIVYGSSITQCNTAPSPARTWPALVSRRLGWDLTALGFAGEAHLDNAVARHIRDTPADLVVLCLGENVHAKSTFNDRSLPSAVTGFISTVRDGHPDAPIVVLTPIASPAREHMKNSVGLTLAQVRDIVADAVRALAHQGDTALRAVDGRSLISSADQHLLGDGLHPTPAGYERMADRIAPVLRDVPGPRADDSSTVPSPPKPHEAAP